MTLDFPHDDVGTRHFEFCFVGFILGGSLQDRKGVTLLRRELALFEKLEAISTLKPCGKKMVNGEPERELTAAAQLEIDAHEFDLLHGYISATPWQTGTPTKHALETLDWLEAASRAQQS
jgi:hypothetical protein